MKVTTPLVPDALAPEKEPTLKPPGTTSKTYEAEAPTPPIAMVSIADRVESANAERPKVVPTVLPPADAAPVAVNTSAPRPPKTVPATSAPLVTSCRKLMVSAPPPRTARLVARKVALMVMLSLPAPASMVGHSQLPRLPVGHHQRSAGRGYRHHR